MDSKFTWTEEFKKTWEEEEVRQTTHVTKQTYEFSEYRKNIVREVVVAMDISEAIEKTDYFPTIRSYIAKVLADFYDEFTKMNPLASISFLTFNTCAQKQSKQFNDNLLRCYGSGQFNILKCLKNIAGNLNKSVTAKEVVIITPSLNSVLEDVDMNEVVDILIQKKIKVNIINLCGDVTFYKNLCKITGGKFSVPQDASEFSKHLKQFLIPSESYNLKCSMVNVGFTNKSNQPGICMCHLAYHEDIYVCPGCTAPVCCLPAECPVCALNLLSPINLCMSMCDNFPLAEFVPFESMDKSSVCKVCFKDVECKCEKCNSLFCGDCNIKIHKVMKFCPFC